MTKPTMKHACELTCYFRLTAGVFRQYCCLVSARTWQLSPTRVNLARWCLLPTRQYRLLQASLFWGVNFFFLFSPRFERPTPFDSVATKRRRRNSSKTAQCSIGGRSRRRWCGEKVATRWMDVFRREKRSSCNNSK